MPRSSVPVFAAFLLSALARPSSAQGLPNPLPPSNPTPIGYGPPERLAAGPPAAQHVLNVFLPRGTAPASGWPVVVATGYGGGASVPPVGALNASGASSPLYDLVAAGIAVVHFGTPGLVSGRGLWYPPGHPSGRYESFRPADDNPEKSAVWALQWVKVQTRYPFDLERVGLRGSSGGAVLAIRTGMGPERARASGSAQVRASTRVAAILAIQPPTSAWALEQGPELTIPFPRHLEQAARPGVAATQLSQVEPELQKAYSLMREAFGSAEARANNALQPLCLVYGDPVLRLGGAVAPLTLDASGFPSVHDAIRQPLQHDSWFGYVFWKRLIELSSAAADFHREHSMFAMRDVNALAPPLAYHTRTFPGDVKGARATRLGHDWLVARLLAPQPLARWEPTPVPREAELLASGCDPASRGSLFPLGGTARAGARFSLGVRGAAGKLACLALTRAPLQGGPCGVRTAVGEVLLDAGALAAPLTPWRRLADGEITPLELDVPAGLAGVELVAQALVLDPTRRTIRLSSGLRFSVAP